MNRTQEAILSRQNMSEHKTLYVEGDLDLNLINAYLNNSQIHNIRIYRIEADKETIDFGNYNTNVLLGAKSRIIEFIQHSNEDETIEKNKYLGIVDTDFDFCFSEQETIDNLIYTDFNSMESYLIDIDLFKKFALDFKINSLSNFEINLQNYMQNFINFNICFLAQVRYYDEFNFNLVKFDDVPLNIKPFIESDYKISINSIAYKVNGCKETWLNIVESKKQELLNLSTNCQNLLYFLHGKHLLRYLIGILRECYNDINNIPNEIIINNLKDKFIITLKYKKYKLFEEINNFSRM